MQVYYISISSAIFVTLPLVLLKRARAKKKHQAAVANGLAKLAGEKAPQAVAAIGAWAVWDAGLPAGYNGGIMGMIVMGVPWGTRVIYW